MAGANIQLNSRWKTRSSASSSLMGLLTVGAALVENDSSGNYATPTIL